MIQCPRRGASPPDLQHVPLLFTSQWKYSWWFWCEEVFFRGKVNSLSRECYGCPLWQPLDLKGDEVSVYEHVTTCLWLYGERLSVPLTIEVLSSICHHRGVYFHRWDFICFLRLAEARQSATSCVGAALWTCLSFSGTEMNTDRAVDPPSPEDSMGKGTILEWGLCA